MLLAALSVQSCAFAPRPPETQRQESAIKRWNGCLLRAGVNAGRMCEGHRRDVLNTYPAHLERQISAKMNARYQIAVASQLGLSPTGITVISRDRTYIADAIGRSGGTKSGDL